MSYTKKQIQQRILQNGKPLDLDKFEWDAEYAKVDGRCDVRIDCGYDVKIDFGDDKGRIKKKWKLKQFLKGLIFK